MLLSQNWLAHTGFLPLESRLLASLVFASLFVSDLMVTLLTSPDKCFRSQRAMFLDEKEGQQVSCPPVSPASKTVERAEQTPNSDLTSAPGWYLINSSELLSGCVVGQGFEPRPAGL